MYRRVQLLARRCAGGAFAREPAVSLRSKLSRLESAAVARAAAHGGAAVALDEPSAAPGGIETRVHLLADLRARIQATLERSARRAPRPPPRVDTVDLPFASVDTPLGPLHVRLQRL